MKLLVHMALICQLHAQNPPATDVSFTKLQLSDKYLSEGASAGDIDADGHLDIVAGPLWWRGPDFKQSFSYMPARYFPIQGPGLTGYSNNFFTFPLHITEDKWPEILSIGLPGDSAITHINPGKEPFANNNTSESCTHCTSTKGVCNESPQLVDILPGSRKTLISFQQNHITLSSPGAEVTDSWVNHHISPKDPALQKYSHGLGIADINQDGLTDILEKRGWWEQPKNWDKKSPWTFHPYPFSKGKGGAQMYAYDIDGDGDQDVVTALDAHGYGMNWYEQQLTKQGDISFKPHVIMTEKPEGNPYGVCFSQLHAMGCADIDGDGIKDIITGKCYFAHNGKDPGADEPAVLYWFRTSRNKDGSAELVPHLIDSDSGVGRQITCIDINKDKKIDIITSNKKGVFLFIQK